MSQAQGFLWVVGRLILDGFMPFLSSSSSPLKDRSVTAWTSSLLKSSQMGMAHARLLPQRSEEAKEKAHIGCPELLGINMDG